MKSLELIIKGRVQGVFYRVSAKEKADQLNVSGFTQNQPDGSVYIEAEGDDDKLTEFVDWCKQGPPRANVTQVEIKTGVSKDYKGFEIRR